ncbi:hypothetical protein Cs7R123_38800 [Catellatospora sp. TT07R-123]|nr:hypothetical protein Cs7R123_38800 [Catellatospora sp. TT07R-123]
MRTLTPFDLADALRPLTVTLRSIRSRLGEEAVHGLPEPLVVGGMPGWTPATALTGGAGMPALFATAHRRWGAAPHAAATLSWKSYCYWVAMPAVLSWAVARRVPLVSADNMLVRFSGAPGEALVQVGLRDVQLAVLPDDPLAQSPHPGVTVVGDEALLLKTLRTGLLDQHLDPLTERIREHVKVGRRTLLGSIASGIAYALVRGGPDVPGNVTDSAHTVLGALDLADLVDLVPGHAGETDVQRRTCCLAFTLPQPKVCSGCCLR